MRLLLLMAALAAGGLVVSLAGARSAACRRACDKIYDTCRFTLDPGVDKAACVKRCEQGRDPRAFARCVESRVCESRSIDACLEASGMPPLYPGQGRAPRGSRAGELCPR